ncbi:MAG: HNH endonuclease [Actinobacteria bacterium]|nr:MAG: HNH endonuclease [Actinomycetota bacterium]
MARGDAVSQFAGERPSLDSHWRALILFGRNVASYKFALGHSLLELGKEGRELVTLEDLAFPFARHICRHLAVADRQATSPRSQFLDACRAHNRGDMTDEQLIETTARLGFKNVIDAFHVLDGTEITSRFFIDERRTQRGIRLTDRLHTLIDDVDPDPLVTETESRWSLVEAAWELNLPRQILTVAYDAEMQSLRAASRRRAPITGVRGALNGYQKGACFYCFGPISTTPSSPDLAQVDHVFAWSVAPTLGGAPVDGVWNLVLACGRCNSWHEKSNRPPHLRYVERLQRRNEFLISSHHPLRPTLIAQTGESRADRAATLRRAYREVTVGGARTAWEAPEELTPRF